MGNFIFLLVNVVVGGLVLGGLGRLVVPGRNRIGFWWTVLCGMGGSFFGGLVATALFGRPGAHWFWRLVLEILAAAVLVALVTRRRRRRWA
ncbi:MAG: GlsB/YeaQ/YmgE family stress response membrane protein [Acidimicrobiales bacterium]